MRILLQLMRNSLDNSFLNDAFNLRHPWAILWGMVWTWLCSTVVGLPRMKQQQFVLCLCVIAVLLSWGWGRAFWLLQDGSVLHTSDYCLCSTTCAGFATVFDPREVLEELVGLNAMHWWECVLWRQRWRWISGSNCASEGFQMVFFFHMHEVLNCR